MAIGMLAAYYGGGCNSRGLFEPFRISKDPTFETHLNKCNVIYMDIQEFLTKAKISSSKAKQSAKIKAPTLFEEMLGLIEETALDELFEEYPNFNYKGGQSLNDALKIIFRRTEIPFVFLINEWDCIFRTDDISKDGQRYYLDYLRMLLTDRTYVGLGPI
jgi:hypothetical protein